MITLHYFYPGCSMASHIALEESGLDYQAQPVNLSVEGERAALLKLNPKGTVPTLVVDGKVLTENVAILCHIARLAPEAKLAPEDAWDYAQCLSLLAWCSNTAHIAFRQSFRPVRFSADEAAHDGIRALGRELYWKALQTFDDRLSRTPYMLGDAYSIADGYPMVFYNWGMIGGYPVDELRHLTAFKDRMLARPAVHKVLMREGCKLVA